MIIGVFATLWRDSTVAIDRDDQRPIAHQVPVAVTEGTGQGVADLHFGNNVQIQSGRLYTVRVSESGDHAVFHFIAR